MQELNPVSDVESFKDSDHRTGKIKRYILEIL